jgi:two-component system, LytTR family, sensor kinase
MQQSDAGSKKVALSLHALALAPSFSDFYRLPKRATRHIAFWAVYALMDTFLAYTWAGPFLTEKNPLALAGIAAAAAIVSLSSKLIITYYVLNVAIYQLLSGRPRKLWTLARIAVVYAISILVYRFVGLYVVNHYMYGGDMAGGPLLSVRDVIIAMIDIGFIAGVAVAIKFVRLQWIAKEKEKLLLREKMETELKFLRNQTHPHFLLNTLNNIYGLACKQSEDTAEVILKLSELLRFMLYQSNSPVIALNEEIRILEDYLELELIRYNDRLNVSFEKEVDEAGYCITPLLLLPLVENAFKHGISETRFSSFIDIDLKVEGSGLHFSIENSKDPQPPPAEPSAIGLANTRRQLELSYQDYDLQVQDKGSSFLVQLTVNLNSHVVV